ncbi:hypothetical protein KIN20_025224 [Parelaphostrongylus tenuis]|uniref:BPTI/Kunitz inhibitor domain-containing protein n=1 Tax=Parelaphostrongylus tenuis TaxID=148309 RepID=A0AAD5MY52_PARTN|nr:hypothetical protein KIN20_025224 [Parelaphostrongylus tenuis]
MFLLLLCSAPLTVAVFDCMVTKDVGVECDNEPPRRMFYYDNKHKVCQPFRYRGCGGNGNRFNSAAECRESCRIGRATAKAATETAATGVDDVFIPRGNSHDQWLKAERCGSNYLIPNGQYIKPVPYCPLNHVRQNDVCCPTKDFVCSLRDDSGQFADGIEDRPRFAWNHAVKSCERFSYFGANGNYNNFPNFYSCLNYCKDSQKLS